MRDEIFNFIQESASDLIMYEKERLKVSMPSYLIKEIEADLHSISGIKKREGDKLMLFGIEVIPHYKNEVVVFYDYFYSESTEKYLTLDLKKIKMPF